jgi:hypothetical protein
MARKWQLCRPMGRPIAMLKKEKEAPMKILRYFGVLCFALVISMVFVIDTQADQWNKKTIITLNQPLQVPGVTLQPGKYVFKLGESSSNRHIVHVFNEDETEVLTTVLAIPNYRLKPTGDSEFGFWETPQGTAPALRAWFYPGDNFGQEFAYPKNEATVITAAVGQTVPSISAEEQMEVARTEVKTESAELKTDVVTEQPEVVAEVEPAPAAEVVAPVEQARVEEPMPAPQADAPQADAVSEEPSVLPATASSFPLVAVLGMLSLGIAFVTHGIRQGLS